MKHLRSSLIAVIASGLGWGVHADTVTAVHPNADTASLPKNEDTTKGWSWSRILESRQPIISSGNIWPAAHDESPLDCFVLVTRNQLMWHCPSGNETSYERTILHRANPGKYRGAFMGLGSDDVEGKGRRMWLLYSPPQQSDQLLELDTVTGEILQKVVIEDCIDGHDAIRIKNRAFIVDTRHGNVVEIAVPPSSPPFEESSIRDGAEELKEEGRANIIKRHTGFTRADHLNNIAVHPDLFISNLHGKGAIRAGIGQGVNSPTRLSALDRSVEEWEGRELNLERDGFQAVENVGTWCHGIAFWEDKASSPPSIKLISLDSKSGTAVSVVMTGPDAGAREVLWEPDEDHPVLRPPEGVARAYNNGAKVFSKGLAVQGGVAYFGVSYARQPVLRSTVPESLLVAVDLETKEELWTRVVRSNGLINQILTMSNLGGVQLPAEMSSMELTHHGEGVLVDYCKDIVLEDDENSVRYEKICKLAYDDMSQCRQNNARRLCCACNGGKRRKGPLLAGKLDREITKIQENVNATVTFIPHHQCRDGDGLTKRLPLEIKTPNKRQLITDLDRDLNSLVKHICNVNVKPIQKLVSEIGDEGFTAEYQHDKNNAVIYKPDKLKFKLGVGEIRLVFSSKFGDKVYHFPWLREWLPPIQEHVLDPMGIPLNQILRLQVVNMPRGSDIRYHVDKNIWVRESHRTHIPIITHPDVFFLSAVKPHGNANGSVGMLRIKSNAGEVYEFNNAILHAVKNLGPSRVHIIIDWVEHALYNEEEGDTGKLVKLRPKEVCSHPTGANELQCGGFTIPSGDGALYSQGKEEL